EMTTDYLRTREQFGRPIGSFQALKHRCATMFMEIESTRAAVEHAALAVVFASRRTAAASIAKSYASDTYAHVAAEGVQLHGAIGHTWEHDMHLYLKRAKLNAVLYGDRSWHHERISRLLIAR